MSVSDLIILVAILGLAAVTYATALIRAGLCSRWPVVGRTLGAAPLFALLSALLALLFAGASASWQATSEQHVVDVRHDGTYRCAFEWPSSSAARHQTTSCPDSTGPHRAVRLRGTSDAHLVGDGMPYTGSWLALAVLLGMAGFLGAAANVARHGARTDREAAQRQRDQLAEWYRRASSADPAVAGRDDLTWDEIAAASEDPRRTGGPIGMPVPTPAAPPRPVAPLTMGYPYAATRIVTRRPDAPDRSMMLLAIGDDAWRVDIAGLPQRTATATVSRNPSRTSDLRIRIGEYDYDIADDPVFLGKDALEALRRHCSRWASTAPAPPDRPVPPTEMSQERH